MGSVREINKAYHYHHYHISLKTVTWVTILVMLAMIVLYPLLGFPPRFDSYNSGVYFHSIGLSMVALVVCLALLCFDLEKHEPVIDFPLKYRALITTALAAATGIFFMTPYLSTIPQIPTVLFVIAVLFTVDITGAVFVELLFLPRKLSGTYDLARIADVPLLKRYAKMFAYSRDDIAAYRKMDSAYWLVLTGFGMLFIGELIGLLVLWITLFGQSFLGFYVQSLGGTEGTLGAILDPHSHGVAVDLMAIVFGLVVQNFRTLDSKGLRHGLTRIGVWISIIGLVALTIVYVAGVLVNYSPPTLFQSGAQGVNGIAGDDMLITMVFVGALIALIPLALTPFNRVSSWRDGIRFVILFTLLLWLLTNAAAGFYIELHHDVFQTTLTAGDDAYRQFQPMFGIFFLTIMAMVLLAVDYYQSDAGPRKQVWRSALIGLLLATLGGLAWVFINPSMGVYFWVYIIGNVTIGVSMLLAVQAIRSVRVVGVTLQLTPKK